MKRERVLSESYLLRVQTFEHPNPACSLSFLWRDGYQLTIIAPIKKVGDKDEDDWDQAVGLESPRDSLIEYFLRLKAKQKEINPILDLRILRT